MLQEDEIDFITFVKSTGSVAFYAYNSRQIPFRNLEKLPEPYSIDFWMAIHFWNKSIGTVKYRLVKEQGYYVIDKDSSIIEFFRSGINKNNELLEGRIYIDPSYTFQNRYGEFEWKKKPKQFLDWYEKIARWITKNYINYGSLYISKRVLEWLKRGGKLTTASGQVITLSSLIKWKR